MPNVICALVAQTALTGWKSGRRSHHGILHEWCGCSRSFHLICFPSELQNNDQRQLWIQAMKWDNIKGKTWKPGDSDRVCSNHFQDGQPTLADPLPNHGTWL